MNTIQLVWEQALDAQEAHNPHKDFNPYEKKNSLKKEHQIVANWWAGLPLGKQRNEDEQRQDLARFAAGWLRVNHDRQEDNFEREYRKFFGKAPDFFLERVYADLTGR